MKDKILNVIKNNKRWCLLFISLIIFLFILENVFDNEIVTFDANVYNTISLVKNDFMTNVFKGITEFGSAKVLILIALTSLVVVKNKKIGTAISLNLASIGLLNYILKNIIQRPRPEGFRLVEETGFSFPSGHSMASMAFYGLIIYFVFKNVKNKAVRITACTGLSILIVLIGMSRIYLGVHYASDVMAGFLVSIVYLVVYITGILKLVEINIDKKKTKC